MDRLKDRIAEDVKMILTEGDQDYLRCLPRIELIDVLERELRFFGVYTLNDRGTTEVVHAFLENNLDEWCTDYLYVPKVEIQESEFCILQTSSGSHITRALNLFFDFTLPATSPQFQIGPEPVES